MRTDSIQANASNANTKPRTNQNKGEFQHLMKEITHSDTALSSAKLPISKESIPKAVFNTNGMNPISYRKNCFKEFLMDAIKLSPSTLKEELDAICTDETGESLDMEYLEGLLDLYGSARKGGAVNSSIISSSAINSDIINSNDFCNYATDGGKDERKQ